MLLSARIDKVFRDIWDNKKRSFLVVITLAIGIAAVGMINNTVRMMKRDMFDMYVYRNPSQLTLFVSPFPEGLARDVAGMREIRAAEAQRQVSAFTFDPQGSRKELSLIAEPPDSIVIDENTHQVQINQLEFDSGAVEPPLRGILLERNSASSLNLRVGDPLTVEFDDGTRYSLTVDGIVHDMTVPPYSVTGEALGYVSLATLDWMGQGAYYNQIQMITTESQPTRQSVLDIGSQVRDRVIEPGGYHVVSMMIRGNHPGEYWAKNQADGILFMMQVMSVLAILLSAGLVVNTISAVLMQQTRQIGIMRSLGASRLQVAGMYMLYVSILSIAGVLLALPLGMAGSMWLIHAASNFLNFDITAIDLPPSILLLQIGLGLSLPVGAALLPVLRGATISVYDAIYQTGLSSGDRKKGRLERSLARIRALSPPVMLSLRNTFRSKSRLAFTLATLTIAGATFMAVFSSYTTIQSQVDELGRYIAYDASLSLPQGANKHTVEREALRVPGIKVAEGWASANVVIVHSDGQESDRIEIVGIPAHSQTIQPRLVAGRWLKPGESGAVVINEDLLSKEPSIQAGSSIEVKINGEDRLLQVVGIASKHMSGSRMYMDYDQLTRLTGQQNMVQMVRVLVDPGVFQSPAEQSQIGRLLEKRFQDANLTDGSSRTRAETFSALGSAFNILLYVLGFFAVILAIIGGLGLTGAMGINILERTREIGVLRAVGASHRSVRQVVVVEGATVAATSWLFAALLSYPAGRLLATAIVRMAFGTQPTFRYSYLGLLVWLGAVVLIGVLSSLAPARDAVRLTVREVLNYE